MRPFENVTLAEMLNQNQIPGHFQPDVSELLGKVGGLDFAIHIQTDYGDEIIGFRSKGGKI